MEAAGGNASARAGGNGTAEGGGGGGAALIACAYAAVCLVGLAGNSLVIYVMLRHAKMRTATNLYLLNLAVADELLLLSVPFLGAATLLRHWPFGAPLCRLLLSVDGANMFTSVYCLTVLSADRYVAVVHPLRAARYRRPSVARAVNAAVWALALLTVLPIALFARAERNSDGTVACNVMLPEPRRRWLAAFVLYTFLLGFLLPVAAISACYLLILAKLRGVALQAGWRQRGRSERRLTLLVLLVVAVFVLCWLPFYAVQLAGLFAPEPADATLSQLAVVLGYANSCANPVLYGFLSDNFRRSFRRLLCLRWLDGAHEEEPADYCATALHSRAYSAEDLRPALGSLAPGPQPAGAGAVEDRGPSLPEAPADQQELGGPWTEGAPSGRSGCGASRC